jgi:hypothetical protein
VSAVLVTASLPAAVIESAVEAEVLTVITAQTLGLIASGLTRHTFFCNCVLQAKPPDVHLQLLAALDGKQ